MNYLRRTLLVSSLRKNTVGPADIASFNTTISLPMDSAVATIIPAQTGSGDPSPTNIRPFSGWSGLTVTNTDGNESRTYSADWTDDAGTIYRGTLDLVSGVLTPTHKVIVFDGTENIWGTYSSSWIRCYRYYSEYNLEGDSACICNAFKNGGRTYQPANMAFGYINDTKAVYLTFRQNGVTNTGSTTAWKAQLEDWAANGKALTVMLAIRTQQSIQLAPNQIMPFIGVNEMQNNSGQITVTYWVNG